MNQTEVTAATLEEAVAKAAEELGVPKDRINAEVIKTSGLIRKKVTVRATVKQTPQERAVAFINGLIEAMHLNCTATLFDEEDAYRIQLSGKDTPVLIGYRGDTLDSVQYLTLLIANKKDSLDKRIVLDGENYREKRTVTLSKLAKNLAFKAAKSGRPVELEPMNPFERRVIHSALADDRFVTTESVGEEPYRHIVIKPNRVKTYDDRGGRGGRGDRSGRGGRYNDKKSGSVYSGRRPQDGAAGRAAARHVQLRVQPQLQAHRRRQDAVFRRKEPPLLIVPFQKPNAALRQGERRFSLHEADFAAFAFRLVHGRYLLNTSFAQLSALNRRGKPMYGISWTSAQTTSSLVLPVFSAPSTWERTCTSAPPIAASMTCAS